MIRAIILTIRKLWNKYKVKPKSKDETTRIGNKNRNTFDGCLKQ